MLVPLDDILAARRRLADHLPHALPTPLQRLESYSRTSGAEVLGKLELLLPTHAFKVRGALNALLCLSPAERERGVIAASAGNHGLGLAYAARLVDVRATVVLPESAPEVRARAIRELGAHALQRGEDWNAANAHALELADAQGYTVVPPFDHPAIMAGQGTIALELLEQLPEVDAVLCAVGGGGLISGVASALAQLRPEVRVYGVETEGADCMARSLAAGRVVELPAFRSIATSLGTRRTGERQFHIVREAVDEVVVVSNEATLRELVHTLNHEKLFLEPAASCPLAALTEKLLPDLTGQRVVPVLCGASVTLQQLLGWLEHYGMDLDGRLRAPYD